MAAVRAEERCQALGCPPVSGTAVVLGGGLLVGEALGLLGGLAGGLAGGVAVGGEAGLLGRPLEGRGVGLAFTGGGGLVVAAGAWGVGDSRSVAVARGRPVPFRSLTSPLAGCVAGRSGEREALGGSVTRTSGSSGDACSGLGAAPGVPADCWGSSSAVARLPSMAKVAAARVRPPYFFSRGGQRRRAAGTSAVGAGGEETSGGPKESGPSLKRPSSTAGSSAGALSLRSFAGTVSASYAPHSGHVTVPLRVRRQGTQ